VRRLAFLVFLPFAAGCGGGEESNWYAGMDGGEAPEVAMNHVGREVRDPASPLHEHRVRLAGTVRGESSEGRKAWVVRVRDLTAGDELCVRVWADTAATVRQYSSEIDACRPSERTSATPS
jgi:hypothetical protein